MYTIGIIGLGFLGGSLARVTNSILNKAGEILLIIFKILKKYCKFKIIAIKLNRTQNKRRNKK